MPEQPGAPSMQGSLIYRTKPSSGYAHLTTTGLAVRGHDLFVVLQGAQIRMLNLKQCKDVWLRKRPHCSERRRELRRQSPELTDDAVYQLWLQECAAQVPYYQLQLDGVAPFAIKDIHINGNGRFMTLMGQHQVAVVALPRPGYRSSKIVDGMATVSCRAFAVGDIHQQSRAVGRVAKVMWHPLSSVEAHLMVLTSDGTLRVYNVLENLDFPEQTHHFGSTTSQTRPTSRAIGLDTETPEAVSFTLGQPLARETPSHGTTDATETGQDLTAWAAFTLYVLMSNGDVYSLAPFMPAEIICTRGTVDRMALTLRVLFETQATLTDVDRFGKYVSTVPASTPLIHPVQLMYTKQWVDKLQNTLQPLTGKSANELPSTPNLSTSPEPVRLQWPTLPMQPVSVGPYLLQPAPPDLAEDDPVASDILALTTQPVPVLALSYTHGQIDLFLQMQPIIPHWAASPATKAKSDFLLGSKLPVLTLYETIDLGLAVASKPLGAETETEIPAKRTGVPLERSLLPTKPEDSILAAVVDDELGDPSALQFSLVPDPLYHTTFYCHHRQGAHCINIQRWFDELAQVLATTPASTKRVAVATDNPSGNDAEAIRQAKDALLERQVSSEVNWVVCTKPLLSSPSTPVIGLVVLEDIYLSYSLMVLTRRFEFIGLELSLRFSATEDPAAADSSALPLESATLPRSQSPGKAPADVPYVARLPLPAYQPSSALTKYVNKPSTVVVDPTTKRASQTSGPQSDDLGLTEARVQYFGERVKELRNQMATIAKSDARMQKRIELQLQEHDHQAEVLTDLTESFYSQLLAKQRQTASQVKAVAKRQSELSVRYDALLHKLLDMNMPVLTHQEATYYADLRKLDRMVRTGDGLESKVQMLQEQLDALKQHLVPANATPAAGGGGCMAPWSSMPNSNRSGPFGQTGLSPHASLFASPWNATGNVPAYMPPPSYGIEAPSTADSGLVAPSRHSAVLSSSTLAHPIGHYHQRFQQQQWTSSQRGDQYRSVILNDHIASTEQAWVEQQLQREQQAIEQAATKMKELQQRLQRLQGSA
ncbi:hypothetical protein H4R34_001613 [Dimargaris verticillata]|uniref:Uncharacterized protein n=1 Tax=Dimargaris verticillata TaxID=2761393 RepID=A0A9W8EA48_9FUNG|nr:hypothetical protein H4R34_001613 [Dimargaris verticillata]